MLVARMTNQEEHKMKTVLIIGCGPAGLGAIEQFLRKDFDVVAYEARPTVGGLWNLDPNPPPCVVKFDENGFAVALTELEHQGAPVPAPTPMYSSVVANTPSGIMTYRSHPYPEGVAQLPSYRVIRDYQEQHSIRYIPYIRFNRVVTRVRHGDGHGKRWLVEWTPSVSSGLPDIGQVYEESFDHIVVANGTDSRPFIPYIQGLWDWKGHILHSRWYRNPEDFTSKTVVVVGSGPSSADIVRQLGLLKTAKSPHQPNKIYRSYRSQPRYDTFKELGWTEHVEDILPIHRASRPAESSKSGRLETVDGRSLDDVDVIIFATSYTTRFEFCRPTDEPFSTAPITRRLVSPDSASRPPLTAVTSSPLEGGHRAHHLDENQLFYLPDPTLAFLLLHAEAIPWPFSEMQARVVASVWSGTPLKLRPCRDDDLESHSSLVLGHPGEFEYAERLLSLIGEGGPEEVDAQGRWGSWPQWKKELRAAID